MCVGTRLLSSVLALGSLGWTGRLLDGFDDVTEVESGSHDGTTYMAGDLRLHQALGSK